MIKRLMIALAVMIATLGVHAPAEAHVSKCDLAAYAPKLLTPHTLRGQGRWYCPQPAHHAYQSIQMIVQYKVVRTGPDYWRGIPPGNRVTTTRMEGRAYTTVECANGIKTYRTLMIFDMYGDQGNRRHEKASGETTKRCGR